MTQPDPEIKTIRNDHPGTPRPPYSESVQPDTRPLTPRAELVMRLADDEAGRLGDTEVTPQHILRALLREGESIAAGVLESLIHPDKVTTALDFIEGRSK